MWWWQPESRAVFFVWWIERRTVSARLRRASMEKINFEAYNVDLWLLWWHVQKNVQLPMELDE
jgi:hypothetical protein